MRAARLITVFTAALLTMLAAPVASAQAYPSKPIKLISPYPPGGGTDAAARIIATALGEQMGQQVVVDTRGGFNPISLVALSDYVLTVHPSLPAKNIKEFIALAKANPDKLTYASSGSLGAPHLAGELLNLLAKVKTVHIPYKGNGPAAIAVMSGETTMMFGTGPSVVPHAHSGKLRMLATTGPKRTLPNLPAMNEILPGYDVTQWYGLLLPAGA
ncbi:MAG: tripartite tricarboxylate transporter substrate binding protein, partial [Betaproteobacteria bacterium]|nr:tripartite tricarboxylate transporter substrate binding protein [Betaproteobacteria bacterium]